MYVLQLIGDLLVRNGNKTPVKSKVWIIRKLIIIVGLATVLVYFINFWLTVEANF